MNMLVMAKPTTSAQKRYLFRTLGFMSSYVGVMLAIIVGTLDDQNTFLAWFLAVAVTAPIAGQIWATLAMMRESDEFVRAVMAKKFILAAGVTMALFTGWGFAETFAAAPHAPGWWIYPLFWASLGVITPFVKSSNR